ncbi:hypothetical protein DFJ58DRAFT_892070 [Suillus subalutaceus]|uniref:uncharacterized protein n=1 Tax=Suillus subalutaceus TaxID=48586 RepID=UPI001B8654DE|nr:uncharacterized protein DFJ58DRAFT_892070 [Suillus subalutaceus]KAG1813769.1 hypothetical protein DFJ58DRAFT_892070 [Suillus subalutaceus]
MSHPSSSTNPVAESNGLLEKVKGGVKYGVDKLRIPRLEDSRSRSPVPQNDEGASSTSVQAAPSGMEVEADTQSALQDIQEADLRQPWLLIFQDAQEDLDAVDKFQDTYLKPLKIFDTVIDRSQIPQVHPYAKMALGVLSCAAKIILVQVDRDKAVLKLLEKLDEVYSFITQDEMLGKISSMRAILGKISQQTRECAHFIKNYSETKNFWNRLGKNIISEMTDTIQKCSDVFDKLMQNFRDQLTLDVAIHVHDIAIHVHHTGKSSDVLRTEILSQITEWVNSTGDNVPRMLWLSGPAGKGKSAIAHTIANWFNETGGLGSCFCFDRHREADRRHEKIFSTIARDLADCDPGMKRALADAVKDANSLKNTTDIIQQWRKLLMQPLKKFSPSSVEPVLIMIRALDESGGVETRRNILHILASRLQDEGLPQITELPSNFRILVTSRPLPDIERGFEGSDHILRLSMDSIPPNVAERDIHTFISEELKELSEFQDNHLVTLTAKADGLFEWARLVCGEAISTWLG